MSHSEGGGGGESGVVRWWRAEGAAMAGEVAGTATLVAAGCLSVRVQTEVPLVVPALAWGGAVAALVTALGPVSGAHFNPAVTLAALISGQVSLRRSLMYLPAQVLGATIGFALLVALTPSSLAGITAPVVGVTAYQAAGVEALLTFVLALVACAAWAADHHSDSTPLVLGATVAGLVFSGGGLSGASLNPARSFGPALVLMEWESHWVYWIGPLSGAALAALLHRGLTWPPLKAGAAPAAIPLMDRKTDEPDV